MSSILTIIPYNFYPPVTGGAIRCFHMVMEMSKFHLVSVITVQPVDDFFVDGAFVFPEQVKIYSISAIDRKSFLSFSSFLSRVKKAIYYRYIRRRITESTNQFLLDIYPVLKKCLKDDTFDIILFENLEAVELTSRICNRLSPASIKVYDAHNVDSELWSQLAFSQENERYRKYALNALSTERKLYKCVDSFLSCSTIDYEKLLALNERRISGIVIPNGVDIEQKPFDNSPNKSFCNEILFCGTLDTVPNKEGLLWFYESIFPLIISKRPHIKLTVIGRITDFNMYNRMIDDPSVNFIGNVDSVTPYYQKASVAVVPLLSGSGTRLKILEAMSYGNPVVSTTIGAEGIDYISGKNILISDDPSEFANYIDSLMGNEKLFNDIRFKAFELVKSNYSWNVIGTKLNNFLDKMLANET